MNNRSGVVGIRMVLVGGLAMACLLTAGLTVRLAVAQPPAAQGQSQSARPAAPTEQARPAVPTGQEQTTHVATRRAHEVVSIAAIDRAARRITVQGADGERRTIDVPTAVSGFEKLKVGDRVEIDYSESIGISVLPPGTKPSVSQRSTGMRSPGPGAMAANREMTVAAEVVRVDPEAGTVSFRGPEGQIRTVDVTDPEMQKRIANLKPGQVIQVSHRESIAASIQRLSTPTP